MAKNDLNRVWKERAPEKKEKTFVGSHKYLLGGVAMLLLAALLRVFLPDETFKLPAVVALFLLMWNAIVENWKSNAARDHWLSIGAALLSALMWLLTGREMGFMIIGMRVFCATLMSLVAKEGWRTLQKMNK